jgi:hypothetical protein
MLSPPPHPRAKLAGKALPAARSISAVLRRQFTDDNCYGPRNHNGFRTRCEACDAELRPTENRSEPKPRALSCVSCGHTEGMSRKGRPNPAPEKNRLRGMVCSRCRQEI